MYRLLTTAKETDLMPITRIQLQMKVGSADLLVANSFISLRIFENHTNAYFHVIPGHNFRKTCEVLKAVSYL